MQLSRLLKDVELGDLDDSSSQANGTMGRTLEWTRDRHLDQSRCNIKTDAIRVIDI